MKLLFCELCADILSPYTDNLRPRWCLCGRHAVWWLNADVGILRVHDKEGPTAEGPAFYNRKAWILALHSDLLTTKPSEWMTTNETVAHILNETPDYYKFKQVNSLVIRYCPGYTSDTAWADLPNNNSHFVG